MGWFVGDIITRHCPLAAQTIETYFLTVLEALSLKAKWLSGWFLPKSPITVYGSLKHFHRALPLKAHPSVLFSYGHQSH